MRKLLLIGLLALVGLASFSCRSTHVENRPFTWTTPDSLGIDPSHLTPVNGWEPYLVNPKTVIWLPPPVNSQKIKVKRSGNTETVVKGSGNTEVKDKSTVKDKSKEKEKTKADIIGDGNTQQKAGTSWWAWVLVGAVIAAALYLRYRY